ncbi:2-PD dehydrogenase), partial [Durusdinium trenchii]
DTRHLPEELVRGCDAVIDLAAVSNDAAGDFFRHSTWSINHWARVRTARLARDAGVRHYLLPSSCSVYGASDALCDESSPVRPLSHYARANLLAEQEILPLASPSFRVSVLRLATVFGNSPRLRLDLAVNALTHDAWHTGAMTLMRDGRQQRPFVHVTDVAAAFCHFLGGADAGDHARLFNIGHSDQNMSLDELATLVQERVQQVTGRQIQRRWYGSPDPRSYRVDFSRIRDALGWQPRRTLTGGIDELLAGFDAGRIVAHPSCNTLHWTNYAATKAQIRNRRRDMLADSSQWPADKPVETSVCIIGGGAAGIILALELERAGISSCLLESGGLQLEPDIQAMYEGFNTGLDYHTHDASRLRFWGGSTNHWTGWTRPLDAIDFEKRDWIPHSGWPIKRDDLSRHYESAQRYFQIGYHLWAPSYWERRLDARYMDTGDVIETGVVRHSPPTRFGAVWGPDIGRSLRVLAFLHANVTRIALNDAGTAVTGVTARSFAGNTLQVRAQHYVLATGGIENARLLLNNRDRHEHGIGNRHDQVGRYFADHRGSRLGEFSLTNQQQSLPLYSTRVWHGQQGEARYALTSGFKLSHKTQRERGLANAGIVVGSKPAPMPSGKASPLSDSAQALSFTMLASVEPLPNPSSRITLTDEKDALGLRRVNLDFRLDDQWHAAVRRIATEFAREWGAAGLGSARVSDDHTPPENRPGYGDHHMGTTRMSKSPRNGVVDENCQVHGMKNLYVAGSSVFPTYGYAQPTFTIGALAIRLASHLTEVLA